MKKFITNILKFIVIFILSALAVLLIDFFYVGNQHLGNYQASILDKTARFRSLESPKIVMAGNSSMAFGMNSAMLEEVAKMAYLSECLEAQPASQAIQHKHYFRKHGAGAYYGQK